MLIRHHYVAHLKRAFIGKRLASSDEEVVGGGVGGGRVVGEGDREKSTGYPFLLLAISK